MKLYYDFFTTTDKGEKEYFIFDVTQISFISHNESVGAHGETTIRCGINSYTFIGCGNKTIYDEIRNIMSELATTN